MNIVNHTRQIANHRPHSIANHRPHSIANHRPHSIANHRPHSIANAVNHQSQYFLFQAEKHSSDEFDDKNVMCQLNYLKYTD